MIWRICTWCGHLPHDGPCTRDIRVKLDRPDDTYKCPCAWRKEQEDK